MSKVQGTDDGKAVEVGFIFCTDRLGGGRVSSRVCQEKCKKIKKCLSYNDWYNKVYGEDFIKPVEKKRIVRRKK